jgi:hypothetical protein
MRRNLRKIPQELISRITTFDVDDVVAACAKRLRPEDIKSYSHIGLELKDGDLVLPLPQIPPSKSGRYSRANVEGREVIRHDLPMVPKTFYWESPNYGDWSNGSHTSSITRDVYQRDLYPPKGVELTVELLQRHENPIQFVVKFAVNQVLNRRSPDFKFDLLYNLNILQENVGAVDVFASTATLEEYERTVKVDWEILPPGEIDDIIRRMLHGKKPISVKDRNLMKERLEVMSRLEPEAYIAGTSGFARYFGAKFADDFVVFENLHYGNALYVMYEDWAILSQRSRMELLKGPPGGFDRIPHTSGWESTLEGLLNEHREGA